GFTFIASVGTVTGHLLYVNYDDTGPLEIPNFTNKITHIDNDAPRWLSVFWAIAIGLLTLAMLMTNGITALQNATIIMGVPFSFVMLVVLGVLYKSLRLVDYRHASRSMN
ncbi:BCCT family transporter, partial [Klebsiella pneumoniae]|uniref:BCCT family transporter n=1 Tax=Klebsiella pneumoniae TaxID=573 RepID=UPI003BF0C8F1